MQRTPEILLVTSKAPPEYSGSGNRVVAQYRRLSDAKKVRFSVLSSSTEKVFALPFRKREETRKISLKLASFFTRSKTSKFNRIAMYIDFMIEYLFVYTFLRLKARDVDLVHIVGDVALTSSAVAFCEDRRIPFIFEIVNEDPSKEDKPLWIRVPFWRQQALFPKSFSTIKTINARYKARICQARNEVNVVHHPNSVDIAKIDRVLREVQSTDSKNKVRIVFLGKFIPRKRQDLLISALEKLPSNYELDLFGPLSTSGVKKDRDALYFDGLLEQVSQKKLGDRVNIQTGFVDKPYELIANYDVFAYPSHGEAFGTPIIEALMLKVPVVASAGEPAFEEWIKDGKNGFLFDGSAEDLAKKIKKCASLDQETQRDLRSAFLDQVSFESADRFLGNEITRLVDRNAI